MEEEFYELANKLLEMYKGSGDDIKLADGLLETFCDEYSLHECIDLYNKLDVTYARNYLFFSSKLLELLNNKNKNEYTNNRNL